MEEGGRHFGELRYFFDFFVTAFFPGVFFPFSPRSFTGGAFFPGAFKSPPFFVAAALGGGLRCWAPSFQALVESLKNYGTPTTMDDQKTGHSGWQVTLPSLDSKGTQIEVTPPGSTVSRKLTHWVTAGSPEYYNVGHFGDRKRNGERLVTPYERVQKVREEARLTMRDDANLAGKMYVQQKDVTTRPVSVNLLRNEEGKIEYAIDDTQWKGDRRISIVKTEGRKVTFKVQNNAWRRQGVLVRFLDQNNELIAKEEIPEHERPESDAKDFSDALPYSTLLEVVEGRFTVLGVPLSEENAKEFTIELPKKAASFEVNIASAGWQRPVLPKYLHGHEPEEMMSAPGAVQTLLLDVALPTMALLLGAGSMATEGSELKKVLAKTGVEVGLSFIMHAIGASST